MVGLLSNEINNCVQSPYCMYLQCMLDCCWFVITSFHIVIYCQHSQLYLLFLYLFAAHACFLLYFKRFVLFRIKPVLLMYLLCSVVHKPILKHVPISKSVGKKFSFVKSYSFSWDRTLFPVKREC